METVEYNSNDTMEIANCTPAAFIQQAISQGLGIEHLEKLMDLQERWEANQARKSFLNAMNEFQSRVPVLEKTKLVSFGNTKYKYAPLGEITETLKPILKEVGLSFRWELKDVENSITCTCIVSHVNGHSESTSMTANKDTSGNKNDIQSRGSTITYLQRYTIIAALGISTADEDNDGRTNVDRNYTAEAEKCKTVDALSIWWNGLTASEKKNLKGLKDNRKSEIVSINTSKQSETPFFK